MVMPGLYFLNLEEIQDNGRLASEEGDKHRYFVTIHVDVADRADKFGEWAVDNSDILALRKAHLRLWLLRIFRHLFQNCLDFVILERNRARARANEAGDTR